MSNVRLRLLVGVAVGAGLVALALLLRQDRAASYSEPTSAESRTAHTTAKPHLSALGTTPAREFSPGAAGGARVVCRDASGRPVAGARVQMEAVRTSPSSTSSSNERGAAAVPDHLVGKLARVEVRHPDHATWSARRVLKGELQVTLESGCAVFVRIPPAVRTRLGGDASVVYSYAGRAYSLPANEEQLPLGRFAGGVLRLSSVGTIRAAPEASTFLLPAQGTAQLTFEPLQSCRVAFVAPASARFQVGMSAGLLTGSRATITDAEMRLPVAWLQPGEFVYWGMHGNQYCVGAIRVRPEDTERRVQVQWKQGATVILHPQGSVKIDRVEAYGLGWRESRLVPLEMPPLLHRNERAPEGEVDIGVYSTAAPFHRVLPVRAAAVGSSVKVGPLPPNIHLQLLLATSGGRVAKTLQVPGPGGELDVEIESPILADLEILDLPDPDSSRTRRVEIQSLRSKRGRTVGALRVGTNGGRVLGLYPGLKYAFRIVDAELEGETVTVVHAGRTDVVRIRARPREMLERRVRVEDRAGLALGGVPVISRVRSVPGLGSCLLENVAVTNEEGIATIRVPQGSRGTVQVLSHAWSSPAEETLGADITLHATRLATLIISYAGPARRLSLVLVSNGLKSRLPPALWTSGSRHRVAGLLPGTHEVKALDAVTGAVLGSGSAALQPGETGRLQIEIP